MILNLTQVSQKNNEYTPDQRRPIGFERLNGWSPEPGLERLTGWFPEPTPREPEDFLGQLFADGVPDQPEVWFLPQQPTQPPMEPPMEPPIEPLIEPPTEPQIKQPTEPPTESPTESPTEPPTKPPTEPPTEPLTEPPTEPQTEPPTEPLFKPKMEPKMNLTATKGNLNDLLGWIRTKILQPGPSTSQTCHQDLSSRSVTRHVRFSHPE